MNFLKTKSKTKAKENFIMRGDIVYFFTHKFSIDLNLDLLNYSDILTHCKTIIFDKNYDNIKIGHLPINIENIIFNDESQYNRSIDNYPFNLKKIKFGNCFSQPLDNLPSSLEELEFASDSEFNCPINDLPNLIKKIVFGKYFNMLLNNLPPNLEYLSILSNCYSHELKNLPLNLKYLYFYDEPDYYCCKEIKLFPNKLIEIRFPFNYSFEIKNLPESVEIIRISYKYLFANELRSNYPEKKIIIY